MTETPDVLVIGAGPAGLMAAEVLSAAGRSVVIAEAKPTAARKFLMAGKSGLNLTKDEPVGLFADHISAGLAAPDHRGLWPTRGPGLGRGSGHRAFYRIVGPGVSCGHEGLAAVARLAGAAGAERCPASDRVAVVGFRRGCLSLCNAAGRTADPAARHDPGAWRRELAAPWVGRGLGIMDDRAGCDLPPLPAREHGVSCRLDAADGASFRPTCQRRGTQRGRANGSRRIRLSARGIEGGGVYALSAAIRDGAALTLDLAPGRSADELTRRLSAPRGKDSHSNHLRKATGLDPVKLALLQEWGRPLPEGAAAVAQRIKALPARLGPPRPIGEAISSAGGIARESLTDGLELRALPGVFVAGEMIDWEAPTGGYLLTGCLATGRHAGLSALARLGGAVSPASDG